MAIILFPNTLKLVKKFFNNNNNNNNNIYPGSPLALAVFSGALQIKNEIKNKIT